MDALSRLIVTATSALALGCVAGCSGLAERLGLRVNLDKVPVTAVSASLIDRHDGRHVTALAPGQSASLVITATTQDGKEFSTVGAGGGKVALDNYRIEASVVTVSKHGVVSLSSDPRVSEARTAQLHIVPMAHPDVAADLFVPARYDIPFVANFSGGDGANGLDGLNGSDGSAGMDGSPGMLDPTTGLVGNPGPGGAGTNGQNGFDGSDGQDGSPGSPVNIWIRVEPADRPLLQIKVASANRQLFYLVDPNGGSLKVLANGGAGGRGGQGGRGGHGGRGGSGFPPGIDGQDGLPGRDGHSGSDGAGGTLTIAVDPAAEPFLKCLSWSNRTGGGRPGASPRISVEPVAPLW